MHTRAASAESLERDKLNYERSVASACFEMSGLLDLLVGFVSKSGQLNNECLFGFVSIRVISWIVCLGQEKRQRSTKPHERHEAKHTNRKLEQPSELRRIVL